MPSPETLFLKSYYGTKSEFRGAVEDTVHRAKRLKKLEKIPPKLEDRIPEYLARIERITKRTDRATGERGRLFLKQAIYPQYITQPENITDEYIKGVLLGNFAERHGYERDALNDEILRLEILSQFEQSTSQDFATYAIPDEERKRVQAIVIDDQTARLNQWFDYLTGPEAINVDSAFRYWAFAEMLKLGNYDETRKTWNKRTENTIASFPELNQQALAWVFDAVKAKALGQTTAQVLDDSKRGNLEALLKSAHFSKLYAFELEHVRSLKLPEERLPITKGKWRHFPKGSNPYDLTQTLNQWQTQWCIAGEGYATKYLEESDIYVYYSEDADGNLVIPRACIVQSGEHGITEVRGIMNNEKAKQHLDDYINPVVEEKLRSLPGGDEWQGTMVDMRELARIHLKHLRQEPLDKTDLTFLYEIDHPIRQSGYEQDPRIAELRKSRNPEKDMLTIFDCSPDQLAHSPSEVNADTKAYVGPWNPETHRIIQSHLSHIDHLYTQFPEEKIFTYTLETDPKINTPLKAEEALQRKNIFLGDWGQDILSKTKFSQESKQYELVQFTVAELGFPSGATTRKIFDKAKSSGLELCPAEVGPQLRLKYPGTDWKVIAMEPVADRGGDLRVFSLGVGVDGLELYAAYARPGDWWDSYCQLVFLSRPPEAGKQVSL